MEGYETNDLDAIIESMGDKIREAVFKCEEVYSGITEVNKDYSPVYQADLMIASDYMRALEGGIKALKVQDYDFVEKFAKVRERVLKAAPIINTMEILDRLEKQFEEKYSEDK